MLRKNKYILAWYKDKKKYADTCMYLFRLLHCIRLSLYDDIIWDMRLLINAYCMLIIIIILDLLEIIRLAFLSKDFFWTVRNIYLYIYKFISAYNKIYEDMLNFVIIFFELYLLIFLSFCIYNQFNLLLIFFINDYFDYIKKL